MPDELEPGWQRLVTPLARSTDRDAGGRNTLQLRACLLTTYDAVDTSLLVEQLLPEWLGIARRFRPDAGAQPSFVIELHEALSAISAEKFVIVSTPAAPAGNPYPWLKNDITFALVGAKNPGDVQHAKLWMLHWESCDEAGEVKELLEVCVSSANLTQASFREQIQLAWRCLVPLEKKPTKTNRATWGILPEFVGRLAEACGTTRETRVRPFADELLGRALCPRGAEFVASVPGTFELARMPWGVMGLRAAVLGHGRGNTLQEIVAPTIGIWDTGALNFWCDTLETPSSLLTLLWISRQCERWRAGWTLPRETVKSIKSVNARIYSFQCFDPLPLPRLHEQHRQADERWLHAKCYGFQRGNWYGSLITSANFTQSAWGKRRGNGITIDNFELGVLISEQFPYPDMPARPEPLHVSDDGPATLLPKAWLAAEWDGAYLVVEFASAKGDWTPAEMLVRAYSKDTWTQTSHATPVWPSTVPWPAAQSEPHEASVVLRDGTRLEVPILDLRPPEVRRAAVLALPGVSEEDQQFWRERVLLERQGAPVWLEEDLGATRENSNLAELAANTTVAADYTVPAFRQFREWAQYLDNWKRNAELAQQQSLFRKMLLKDGADLASYFEQRAKKHTDQGCRNAANLIAEEFRGRLKLLSEE